MTVTTIRPSFTQADGRNRSSSTVLATAQAGSSINTTNSVDPLIVGQRLNGSTYELFITGANYDCSSIASTDSVSAASLEITFGGSTESNASDIEIWSYDQGTVVTSADWINPTTLSGSYTLLGTLDKSLIVNGDTVQIALNSAGIAAVQAAVTAGGNVGFTLLTNSTRIGTTPAADERVGIRSSENATAANRPALIVTHSSPVSINVTGVEALGELGTATVQAVANASPTGVEALGELGTATVKIGNSPLTVYPQYDNNCLYSDGVDWAASRAETSVAEYSPMYVGWESGRYLERIGLIFDTSVISKPTVTDVVFSIYCIDFEAIAAFTIEARLVDLGASFSSADLVDPDTLGSYPLLATLSSADLVTSAYNTFTNESAFPSSINLSGNTGIYLSIAAERTDTDPGANAYAWFEDSSSGTTYEPKLYITASDSTPVSVNVTGVSATGSVGTVTVQAEANALPTGVFATGAVGTTTVQAKANVSSTGVEALGAVGTATASSVAPVDATGVEATGESGAVVVQAEANALPTGVEALGELGAVTVTISAGGAVSVDVNSLLAAGDVGTVVVQAGATVSPTGVEALGELGSVATSLLVVAYPDGVEAIGEVGQVVATAAANVYPSGTSATGGTGTVTVDTSLYVSVTGVSSSGEVGTVTVQAAANLDVSDVVATGYVGSVIASAAANTSVTGVEAIGDVGSVSVVASSNVYVSGVQAVGLIAQALVWGPIDSEAAADWQPVNDGQTGDWVLVDDGNTVTWVEVPT